jgi:hypothetical protein
MPIALPVNAIPINAYVFSAKAAAQACANAVDLALGYPNAATKTITYDLVISHPTLALWSYISDSVTLPILTAKAAQLGLPASVQLDTAWYP